MWMDRLLNLYSNRSGLPKSCWYVIEFLFVTASMKDLISSFERIVSMNSVALDNVPSFVSMSTKMTCSVDNNKKHPKS